MDDDKMDALSFIFYEREGCMKNLYYLSLIKETRLSFPFLFAFHLFFCVCIYLCIYKFLLVIFLSLSRIDLFEHVFFGGFGLEC